MSQAGSLQAGRQRRLKMDPRPFPAILVLTNERNAARCAFPHRLRAAFGLREDSSTATLFSDLVLVFHVLIYLIGSLALAVLLQGQGLVSVGPRMPRPMPTYEG